MGKKRAFDAGFMCDPPTGLASSSGGGSSPETVDGGGDREETRFADLDDGEKASLKTWLVDKQIGLQCERDTPAAHYAAKIPWRRLDRIEERCWI